MHLLSKLTIKNLNLNKKRTIVTIIGIMLSVALITAVASMYSSAISSLIDYETSIKGNFHFAFLDVPIKDIENFTINRKIEDIYITQNVGYAILNDSKNEYKPYAYVLAYSKGALDNLAVNLVEGRMPENDDEIIIPTHLKTNGRVFLNVGDTITLDIGKRVTEDNYELGQYNPIIYEDKVDVVDEYEDGRIEEYEDTTDAVYEKIIDTTTKTYKIVGVAQRPASNIEPYDAPGYTFITYTSDVRKTDVVDVYARYDDKYIKDAYKITANILGVDEEIFVDMAENGSADREKMEKYVKELEKAKYEYSANNYLISLQTQSFLNDETGGLNAIVVIVWGIIIVTSVFCIKNSFDISITEKTKQYGMLRSVGATRKQIRHNVFFEATILGAIGIPLGIFAGFFASSILIVVCNYFLKDSFTMNFALSFKFSWFAVIAAIVLGIVTIYLSAFRSARRASKVSPIESIRNSANIKIKAKKLRTPKIISKIFGMGGEISYKNLKRNRKKYRTTVISIVVSVFIFIALSSFMSLAFREVENELRIQEYNINLYTDVNNNMEYFKKVCDTTKLDNIKNYIIERYVSFNWNGAKFNSEYSGYVDNISAWSGFVDIQVVGEEQYRKYINNLGLKYEDVKDKGILVDNISVYYFDEKKNKDIVKNVRMYDYNVGDKIAGHVSEKAFEIEIAYVTDVRPFGLNFRNDPIIIISDELYDSNFKTRWTTIYFDSSDANKLQDEIEEMLDGESYTINNSEENARLMNNLFTLIGIFLYGFIIVITLIGVTNIFNTITTNMELRRQEFAMLKSVGMTTNEFNRMIRLETLFMGLKSLLFGVPIGIGLSYIIYHFLGKDSGLKYELPVIPIIIAVVAVFALIAAIMSYSMSKISKQNTIETIRNENI